MSNDSRNTHPRLRAPTVLAAALLACTALAGCDRAKPQAVPAVSTAGTEAARAGVFEISAKGLDLKDGTDAKLYLMDQAFEPGKEPVAAATAKVKDGGFVLMGNVDRPSNAELWLGEASASFVLENAKQRLEMTEAGPVVRGGTINELVNGYQWDPAYVAARVEYARVEQEAFEGVDMEDEARMTAARAKLDVPMKKFLQLREDYQHGVLTGTAPTLAKLLVLIDNGDMKRYPEARRDQMLAQYAKELGENHPALVGYRKMIATMRQAEEAAETFKIGAAYKPVQAVDEAGKVVKLADVVAKNKIVMIDFWASWCSPCRGEFPHLEKVYKEFHDKGFEIYAVSLDTDHDEWTKALKEERAKGDIPWINLIDMEGMDSLPAKTYGVTGLPDNYLIGQDGKIVGRKLHEWDIEREVRARFKALEGG